MKRHYIYIHILKSLVSSPKLCLALIIKNLGYGTSSFKDSGFHCKPLEQTGYKSYVAAVLRYYYSLELVSYHVEKRRVWTRMNSSLPVYCFGWARSWAACSDGRLHKSHFVVSACQGGHSLMTQICWPEGSYVISRAGRKPALRTRQIYPCSWWLHALQWGANLTAACPEGGIKETGETHALSMNSHSSAAWKFSRDPDNKG